MEQTKTTREERMAAILKANKKRAAERRVALLFAQTIEDDSIAMEIADIYPNWKDIIGTTSKIGLKFQYGLNDLGDPQLYVVIGAEHKFSEIWPPSTTSLYKKWGISNDGYPIWTQPLGQSDAYAKGDMVSFNDKIYESTIDNNVWSPTAYPAGWKLIS